MRRLSKSRHAPTGAWFRRHPRLLALAGLLLLSGGVGFWYLAPAQAQTATTFSIESVGSQVGLGNADLRQTVINVIRWALGFLTLLAVVYVIYGGFVWLTAAGNEDRVEKAKQIILQAMIGLVIILLAWAIVAFVARTFARVTTNSTNSGNTNSRCLPGSPGCPISADANSFDVTAITTCSAPVDFANNVPRSSAVAVYFNRRLDTVTAQKAVDESKTLAIKRCDSNDPACTTQSLPKPIDIQKFALNKTTSTAADVKSEWIAKSNSNAITLHHQSFSDNPADPGYRLFESNQKYRIFLPSMTAANALTDTTTSRNPLQHCRSSSGGPIPGDDPITPNCVEDTTAQNIHWTLTTGTDVAGPPIEVTTTEPSSGYASSIPIGIPDRDVNRDAIIGVQFSGAIDPSTLTPDSFTVTKFTSPPTVPGNYRNGTLATTPIPATDFEIFYPNGTGALLKLKDPLLFEAFTWYKVEVKGVRNLCGTIMDPNPYTWVFETNDAVPGVKKVYPPNESANICPATKIKIIFATSMWNRTAPNCDVGSGSYVTSGTIKVGNTVVSSRSLRPVGVFNPAHPNASCKEYEFQPDTALLAAGSTYSLSVFTDRVMDSNGKKLEYGDDTNGKPWHFTVSSADTCVQPPLITKVSPNQGTNGQCVSVLGNYFEKPAETTSNGQPEPGDSLSLAARSQTPDSWTDTSIVSTVDAGTLGRDRSHEYKVTVHYTSPVQADLSDTASFRLNNGSDSQGPCLLSLSQTSGPAGTTLSATGKRFGAYDAAKSKILYPQYQVADPTVGTMEYGGGWTDTKISTMRVRQNTTLGTAGVSILDAANQMSNEISFTTTATPTDAPGAPRISESAICDLNADPVQTPSPNPKKGDTQACLNVWPEVKFTITMNKASLEDSNNVFIEDCSVQPCTKLAGVTNIARGDLLSVVLQTPKLTPAHTYRVTVANVQSQAGIALATPYTWQFGTKADAANCPISSLSINETSKTFSGPISYFLTSSSRDAACRTLNNSGQTFAWTSSKPTVAAVQPANQKNTTAVNDAPEAGTTEIKVTSESRSDSINVSFDSVFCKTSTDCAVNQLTEACPGSKCVANRCTPVVNSIDHSDGAVGSWPTVKGCWFGGYVDGASKVIFGADQDTNAKTGLAPDQNICGAPKNTWTNERIVREVPAGAVTGKVKVVRGDNAEASSTAPFTVNSIVYPGLCKVFPAQGTGGSLTTASGARFGANESAKHPSSSSDLAAQDALLIKKIGSASTKAFSLYTTGTWTDTSIGSKVPPDAEVGWSDIMVKNNGISSNPLSFKVKSSTDVGTCSAALACADDSSVCPNAADGTIQGCSAINHCCLAKPRITGVLPPAGPGICRNSQFEVAFSQPLDSATVSSSSVLYTDNGVAPQQTNVSTKNTATTGTIIYQPGLLSANHAQRLSFTSNTIRGANGVLADVSQAPFTFTTGADICTLDAIHIQPNSQLFSANGETHDMTATAYSSKGTPLMQTSEYAWNWGWRIGDSGLAAVTANSLTNSVSTQTVTANNKNGSTFVEAKATVTRNVLKANDATSKSAQASINISLCENPWIFTDSAANCDVGGSGCQDTHFNLTYCRGKSGTNLLPDFSYAGTVPSTGLGSIEGKNDALGRLKTIFFKEDADSTDAIGMLIYDNPDFLSPYDWYSQRFPSKPGGATTTVGGYPAVRTGSTTYIGITDLQGSKLVGRMIVMDYNSNVAEGATKAIYLQLLDGIEFNANLPDATVKGQVQRDTKRLQDLANIGILVETYKQAHSAYPALDSGSYIPGLSTSKWPSWQSTLGNAVGNSVPLDPLNTFPARCDQTENKACTKDSQCSAGQKCGAGFCTVYEAATCWSEPQKKFSCPVGSSVYLYQGTGSAYKVYATMEYHGPGAFGSVTPLPSPCTGGSNCGCFNYALSNTTFRFTPGSSASNTNQ